MSYFTPLHWIALAIILLLFVFLVVVIVRQSDEKSPVAVIFVMGLLCVMVGVFAFFGLDSYTKIARLENMNIRKVLINESFSISGSVRNQGKFTIGTCKVRVEISDEIASGQGTSGLFTPKSGLGDLFTSKKKVQESVPTTQTFIVSEDLGPGEVRSFTLLMRYPSEYKRPNARYELSCY